MSWISFISLHFYVLVFLLVYVLVLEGAETYRK